MKIRHPWLITLLASVGAWVVRLWIGTLRYRYHFEGIDVRPERVRSEERYLYAFWHENILLLAYHYGRPDVQVLISQHADGQLIAEICRRLGFGLVRGSTRRGGTQALLQMLRLGDKTHLAITPDGPRGPRRRLQPGLVYLAARTGRPIVPIGIAFRRAWRLGSWDRFALPWPWTVATCVTAAPIRVPADTDKDQLHNAFWRVQEAMHWANAAAQRWAQDPKQPPQAGRPETPPDNLVKPEEIGVDVTPGSQ